MTSLTVDGIRLEFDDSWEVVKWDKSPWYVNGIMKLSGQLDGRPEGTKAVDVLGVRNSAPFLFEVKDFRGFPIENKQRQFHELPLEVGLKARDTVAGLVGWVALGKDDALPLRWVQATKERQQPVHVLALIAEDSSRPGEASHKRAAREDERASRMKQRLAWLTTKVHVKDPLRDREMLDKLSISARSEAGAGPARRL